MSHITTIGGTVPECDVVGAYECVTVTSVIIEVTETTVRVLEADDLKRLDAEVPVLPPSAIVATTLIDSGLAAKVERGHAVLFADALRALAVVGASAPDWSSSFEHMLEYAAGKGWYDRASNTIRVHLEVSTPEAE